MKPFDSDDGSGVSVFQDTGVNTPPRLSLEREACLSDDELKQLASMSDVDLPTGPVEQNGAHLASCAACRVRMDKLRAA